MESAVWIRDWWTSHSWQRMQWYETTLGVSTAGNGYSGTPWTLDQVRYLFLSVDNCDGWDEKC